MQIRAKQSAFSLVEVVIAVGLFATSISVILLLIPNFVRQSGNSADLLVAQQFSDALSVELQRVASIEGFDSLGSSLPDLSSPLPPGRRFVATRDGARLHSLDHLPTSGAISETEQYFLLECYKFTTEPLRPGSTRAFLAVSVRVNWPYRIGVPGGPLVTTQFADRSQFNFSCAINR